LVCVLCLYYLSYKKKNLKCLINRGKNRRAGVIYQMLERMSSGRASPGMGALWEGEDKNGESAFAGFEGAWVVSRGWGLGTVWHQDFPSSSL
jgi:hypothetical protein